MGLIMNSCGELYRSDDFDGPRPLKLKPCGDVRIGGPAHVDKRKGMGEARCAVCGAVFAKRTANHAFCSDSCKRVRASEVAKERWARERGKRI